MNRLLQILFISTPALAMMWTGAAMGGEKAPSKKDVKAMVAKAYDYLKSAQNDNGSFAPKIADPGVSALVAAALLHNGYTPDDPVVAKTLKYVTSKAHDNGGIYSKYLANYTTAVAVMALSEANADGRYKKILSNAVKFLKGIQNTAPESKTTDAGFGGFGYDKKSRPDTSNTIFSVEALLAAGVPKDDPAIQKAMKFLGRVQNLSGEHNDQAFAKKATKDDKGGLTYTPFVSKKNKYATPEGGLRSLGSMTYGGLKSFLYAGVKKDDPRVKAALNWIRRHYTLEENPGMRKNGLFYYYHTFAKAMNALGEDNFADAKGVKHNWRAELLNKLRSMQQADGSWVNRGDRFGESAPELATAFALLSVRYCR